MSGFESNVIGNLRDTLQDRYKDGYAVLKELIQNADDAGASELHVAFVEMLANVQHELLRGPVLLVVNNARFTYQDAAAMHQERGGSKGLDESKIGKFGLGLKSVFHLCEAFIYVSDEMGDAEAANERLRRYNRTGILNPWAGLRFPSWDHLDGGDREVLRTYAEAFVRNKQDGWFSLFIPLRLKQHCRENAAEDPADWAIEEKYFDETLTTPPSEIFSHEKQVDLLRVLPFLSGLDNVEFWHVRRERERDSLGAITRVPRTNADWRTMPFGRQTHAGQITLRSSTTSLRQEYAGHQELLDDPELNDVYSRDDWPRFDAQTSEGRRRGKAQAKQHVGVLVLERPGAGKLAVRDAVFIPLGDPPYRREVTAGKCDFELLLHGYFFVDAGRLGVDEPPKDRPQEDETTRQRWNRLLRQKGIFPLVIPALAEYANSIAHQEQRGQKIEALSSLLVKDALWRENKELICASLSWSFRIVSDTCKWMATEATLPLVELPDCSDHYLLTAEVFPALKTLADEAHVTFAGLPRLAVSRPRMPSGFLKQLLQSVPVSEVCSDDHKLQFLADACKAWHREWKECDFEALSDLIRRLLYNLSANKLEGNDALNRLIQLIPPKSVLPIPLSSIDNDSKELLNRLVTTATDVVPVPCSCLTNRKSCRHVVSADARALLQNLAAFGPTSGESNASFEHTRQEVTAAILGSWEGKPSEIINTFGDIKVFSVQESGETKLRTGHELKVIFGQHRLFGKNDSLLRRLSACIVEDGKPVYITSKAVAQILGIELGRIPSCDVEGCVTFLNTKPLLIGTMEARAELVREMVRDAAVESDNAARRAIRYLIHGNQGDIGDVDLYTDKSDAWSEAAGCMLDARGERWRLVSPTFVNDFRPSELLALGINGCDPVTVSNLARDIINLASVDCHRIIARPDVYGQILREWPDDAADQLKGLKAFVRSDNGQLTSVTDQTFIEGDFTHALHFVFPDRVLIKDETGVLASRRLVPTVSPCDVLTKVLSLPNCAEHCERILDSLESVTIDGDLRKSLRTTRWLRNKNGTVVAPVEVICLEGIRSHVAGIRKAGGSITHKDELESRIVGHKSWREIQKLCPSGQDDFKTLGRVVESLEEYRVGEGAFKHVSLDEFITLFSGSDSVMPTAALLEALREHSRVADANATIEEYVLPAVQKPLNARRYAAVLKFLSASAKQHVRRDANLINVFNHYLAAGIGSPGFHQYLSELEFQNQNGEWTDARRLALAGGNISPVHLVEHSHKILFEPAVKTSCPNSQPRGLHPIDLELLDSSASRLRDELRRWRSDDLPDDAIAAVVAVLGDYDGYPDVYEELTPSRSLAAVRDLIGFRETGRQLHFCIHRAEAGSVRATNLIGEEFLAEVAADVDTLFDPLPTGYLRYKEEHGHRYFPLWLRPLDASRLSAARKLEILSNTVQMIRSRVWQIQTDFEEIWEKLSRVDQLDIEVAQNMILESSAILLEAQLSVGNAPQLRNVLSEVYSARKRAEIAESDKNKKELELAQETKRGALENLRAILVNDGHIQDLLINEVRKRLDAASYKASSIPFELFQNADDAIVELETLCGRSAEILEGIRPRRLLHSFGVEIESTAGSNCIRFLHWGRSINQFRIGERTVDSFDRDMEKMLVLQGSGKDDGDVAAARTGKFGLGFKSVFFVCDEPQVLSGARSRFAVKAGIYPERLAENEQNHLRNLLDQYGDGNGKGTVFELPLRDDSRPESVLSRFREYVRYLVVFARRIRNCSLASNGQLTQEFAWVPSEIQPGIEIGNLPGSANEKALVFRVSDDSYGAVLLHLTENGVPSTLSCEIPQVWITTPTEHVGYGAMIVNAPFDPNPGRTQLRDTRHNQQIAEQVGSRLGGLLCKLHEMTDRDWQVIGTQLGCEGISQKQFWSSVWKACHVFAGNKALPIIRQIVFGEKCGLRHLVQEKCAIPTGLPGRFEDSTSLEKIHWRTAGLLGTRKGWNWCSEIDWITEHVEPGNIVSAEIASHIDRFESRDGQPWSHAVQELSLARLMEETLGESARFISKRANELGKKINERFLLESDSDDDVEATRRILKQARFVSVSGSVRPAHELCVRDSEIVEEDEREQAKFAPDERVLSSEYSSDGVNFFIACRGAVDRSAEELTEWGISIKDGDEEKQRAFADYLVKGSNTYSLQQQLESHKDEAERSWLGNEASRKKATAHLGDGEKAVSLGRMNKAQDLASPPQDRDRKPPPATRSAKTILCDIADWWRAEQHELLASHDRRWYGSASLPKLSFDASHRELESDPVIRREWLILFLRATLMRIGRVTDDQNRGFLELCDDSRFDWLNILAEGTGDANRWFDAMDAFLDRPTNTHTYFQWMNQLLAFYQLARWLPSYATAYAAITRPNVKLDDLRSIKDVANLRESHVFGRATGFDAPPCSRTLGLGSHFVLRETIRARVSRDPEYRTQEAIARFAFVPSQAVCRLLDQITNSDEFTNANMSHETRSARIMRRLSKCVEDPTFQGGFDIPLRMLTWKQYAGKREEFLMCEHEGTDYEDELDVALVR